jgi:putative tricarboxylic transport membrane protein
MFDLTAIDGAFGIMGSAQSSWLLIIPGLLVGLIFGALPGISVTMAMALFLPLTMYMDFLPAIIFLTSIFTGAGFGGSVPAVLMGIPGTSSAVATTFDGYPMARQGRHNEGLGLALGASTTGTTLSYILLFLLIESISRIVLKIGPVEMFAIAIWGMMLLGSLAGTYVARGLLAGTFGLLLGTVGMNTAGFIRGTADIPWLLDGIPVVPAMMGLLAASQLLNLVNTTFLVESEEGRRMSVSKILQGVRDSWKSPLVILRGSAIGIFVGAIPGVGASISNLLSYAETKRNDPDPDSFGQGNPKGIIAAESANSSSEGGSMATMLALGIPGGGATAILLAAFATHNIVGGPQFIAQNKDIVYAIIFMNFAQAMLLLVFGLAFVFVASSIVRVPLRLLIPTVLVVATFGAFAVTGDLTGPITLFVFAVIGWGLSRYEYPVAATVVGLLLGRLVETQLLRSYQVSGGEITYLLERPGAILIVCIMILSTAFTAFSKRRRKHKP